MASAFRGGRGQHRRHARQRAADADRAAGFRRRRPQRRRHRRATSRRSSPPTSGAPACSRRSISAAYIERIANIDALPRFADWRAINAQALVTGRLTRQTDGRLKAEFRLWDVFSGAAADRPAILHRAGQLAPHRPHHLRRDLRAAHRRQGLLRQPRGVRRRIRVRRSAASSGSPSWTRTAPTCATSRAATISC